MSSPDAGVLNTGAERKPEPGARLSLGEAMRGKDNGLGLVRLVLAALVIFHHAFPLGGYGHDPVLDISRGQASIGSLAVGGFFAISGYLIGKSAMSGDVVQFMWRRTLRIFPAFWFVLLVTAFVIAPLIWLAEGREFPAYFGPGGGTDYLLANWTLQINSYGIHDLLATTTPYGRLLGDSAFNGSLWTLAYEWTCYLIIAVLVAFGIMKNARIIVPLLTALFFLMQVVVIVDAAALAAVLPPLADPKLVALGLAFLAGSTFAVYSRSVPFDDRLGILSAVVLFLSLRFGGFATVGTLAGAYFVLYLGARLPKRVHWIGAKNDYSYGVYIYGFLVQQVVAYLGWYRLGYVPYAVISLVITFGFAWISWHLVEKRAMSLKDRGPGRGWKYWFERARARFPRKTVEG